MKNSRLANIAWNSMVFVTIAYISYSFRENITYGDIEPLISILQSTSAMVFTVMGIWIAYVYPNAVLKIVQPTRVSAIFSNEDLERVRLLVGVVILSSFILASLVLGVTIKPFIVKSIVFIKNKSLFTSLGLWWILSITYAQLFCIYAVIASSVNFIIDLKNLNTKKNLSEKLDGKEK